MTPFISDFYYKPIKRDITSFHDPYPVETTIGYEVVFTLQTRIFTFQGTATLYKAPLTEHAIHNLLIKTLKDEGFVKDVEGLL